MNSADVILIITATLTALMAGFFFSYSVSVSVGLGKLDDKEYLKAMQNINREVQNPIFFTCFFGAMIMLPIVSFQQYSQPTFAFFLIATLLYLIGVFGATVTVNVPLNNKLELFDLSKATETTVKQFRESFEGPWNLWNHFRSIASLGSIILIILAIIID